jgi:2-polyprenyl-3-methyl-5-hydroxy-6-metoxy-1,4-benzoquinol methylase
MNIAIDHDKLNALLGRAIVDFGAVSNAPLVLIGDRLGLYRTLADEGPLDAAGLATRTKTSRRYVQEWLNAQAASGYVDYDAATQKYAMSPEQAMMFAQEGGPAFVVGGFQTALAASRIESKLNDAFQNDKGIGWEEQDDHVFCGIERFFRPGYAAHLTGEWLPALDGVVEKLRRGVHVADIGCGHGASTILMAQAFPKSTFHGFDYHDCSIREARKRAADAGVADRAIFETASAKDFPARDYALVTVFDALHDMGDPVGAAKHIRSTLAKDGTWMIVEPAAGDRVEDNLHPVGRAYYAASTLLCTPGSKAQEVGLALGAQAGEARIRKVVTDGGFTQFRRAAQTPFNFIFEARA